MRTPKFLMIVLFFCSHLFGANIVFDLHGVLINVSHTSCLKQIPLTTIAHYSALDAPSFFGIQQDWFSFLDLLDDEQPAIDAYDPSGTPVPYVMTNNLKGIRSCDEICSRARTLCATNHPYFRSSAHRDFMLKLTEAIFTPALFTQTVSWYSDMVDLIIDCKQRGHNVYILSNLDAEQFEFLKKAYPYHIGFFDGIIISGNVKMVKPDPAIYKHLLATYHFDPAHTFFIDDQAVNCRAAESCGIASILCPQKRSWKTLWGLQPDAVKAWQLINLVLGQAV